ncbi:MAG: ABC transporter ATP-binding protein [Thermodesulfovibrionales bacterium]|nr:ABC transporter ATP-binding protein [Thermodesulfovibrionales bacterium]
MNNSLLTVKDLSIYLKGQSGFFPLISKISFDIRKAEVFGIVGESGCGKTLTALSIMRILPQNIFSEGEILFNNRDILSLTEEEMRKIRGKDISMIFQEPMTSLNPVLTVGRQIAEALMTHFNLTKRDSLEKAIEILKRVKIPDPELRIKDYPHQLSGGMRQRVMIGMAIACNPSLLIADEPTTALDVTIQFEILKLLQDLRAQSDMAILFISHDLSLIYENADRVGIMYGGRLIELANVDELFDNPIHPYTRGLLASLPTYKGEPLKPILGFVPHPAFLPKGCKFSDRCKEKIEECLYKEPELLEVTKEHFVRCIKC